MKFAVKSGNPEKQRTACVVVGIYESRRMSPAAEQLDEASGGELSGIIRRGDMDGKLGQTLILHAVKNVICDRVLMVGCGRERDLVDRRYRDIIAQATTTLNNTGATEAVSYLTELTVRGRDDRWKLRQAVEATGGSLYQFDALKSEKDQPRRPLRKLTLSVPNRRDLPDGERAVREGAAIVEGMRTARDLANQPGNICTPSYLADYATSMGKSHKSLSARVLNETSMAKLGMGSLLSVSAGSEQPAKLIVLEYRGGKKKQPPVVLVGKGVTFDSGGISLKPGKGMDEMKFDMCGAAAVLGTMRACVDLELPLNLVVLVPTTENMPDGRATKPGDVVTSLSGQTIEILNTDAEGRLILCDALTYAERYKPSTVIDIATLTGACVAALGKIPHGLFSNHEPLANDLLAAGKAAADRAWEMPLWDEYQDQLNSNFADMANIGGPYGGAITAACFLSRFTKKYHWAHLDIAGTSWISGDTNKGATGRPVPLLVQYLLDQVNTAS
jgi:leucyl aminopeptidase